MKIKNFLKGNWFFIVAAVIVAAALITLNILFINAKALESFLSDDLYWTSNDFTFDTLTRDNGRYLGNILVLIISKMSWLKIIVGIVASAAIIYVLSLNGGDDRGVYFSAAAALFFAMPSALFQETVAWMSGFANYVPAAIVVVSVSVIFKMEFFDEEPRYCKAAPCLLAALALFGAMFIETVAVGNIVVGIALIIYHSIRFKKPCASLIAFFCGAVVGAILVFIDPVYLSVLEGEDPQAYREVVLNIKSIVSTYFNQFHFHFVFNNFWLNLLLVGMFAWMAIMEFPLLKKSTRAVVAACLVVQFVFLLESGLAKVGVSLMPNMRYIGVIKGGLSFLFCAAILFEVIFLIKDVNLKLDCLYLIGCILVYTLPMLVIQLERPSLTRPYIFAYLLFASMAITLLNKNISDSGAREKLLKRCFSCAFTAAIIAFAVININTYSERLENSSANIEAEEVLISENSTDDVASDIYVGELIK